MPYTFNQALERRAREITRKYRHDKRLGRFFELGLPETDEDRDMSVMTRYTCSRIGKKDARKWPPPASDSEEDVEVQAILADHGLRYTLRSKDRAVRRKEDEAAAKERRELEEMEERENADALERMLADKRAKAREAYRKRKEREAAKPEAQRLEEKRQREERRRLRKEMGW